MSAALMLSPARMGEPFRVRLPAPGSVVMVTARSWSPSGSEKPKSAVDSVLLPFSGTLRLPSLPDGASLTAVTVIATVSLSVLAPPEPVLPWSSVRTVRVSLPW